MIEKTTISKGNQLIADFMGETKPQYKVSRTKDINGVLVKEGDIINADGYNSDIKSDEIFVHCVELDEDVFGSNIYRDFEPISSYEKIEVIGHCEDFRHLYNTDKWGGNLGEVLKDFKPLKYNESWKALMPAVEKIEKLGYIVNIYGHQGAYTEVRIYEAGIKENGGKISFQMTGLNGAETKRDAVFLSVIDFINWYINKK